MNKDIKPCEGVGDIKFGMTRDELIELIGEADEVLEMDFETDEEGVSGKVQTWHYDYLELSVSFEEEVDWTLTVISVSGEEFTFKGEKIIGLDMESVLTNHKDIGAVRIELEEEELGQELIIVEDLHLNLWFEGSFSEGNTKLTEIQIEICD